jgi:hypothetical protein
MSNSSVFLLLLHVAILGMGSTVLWAAERWPRTVVVVCGFLAAGGVWAMWSAGNVMEAHGPEAGERVLRIGQWIVALAIAAWGLVAVIRRSPGTTDALIGWARWANWAIALAAYWFMCFVVALFEGLIIYLGTTPPGQFR